jgi:hypothetical protein
VTVHFLRPILRSIAFVISRINDGLSVEEVNHFIQPTSSDDKEFVLFCIEFAVENKFLQRKYDEDRYTLTPYGREFISSQFG